MSTGLLNIDNVELVSTIRTAPFHGAPSSQDYNDSQRETLQDIATLADTFNSYVIPLLSTLAATDSKANPNVLNGDTVFASSDSSQALFLDSTDQSPLTVAQVFSELNAMIQAQQTTLTTLGARVSALTTLLSSSNQQDMTKAIQGYATQLAGFYTQLSIFQSALVITQSKQADDEEVLNRLKAATPEGILPYDIVCSYVGQPDSGAVIFVMTLTRRILLQSGFFGLQVTCGANPSSLAVFGVTNNGAPIGTISIDIDGTFSATGAGFVLNIGDRLAIVAPSPQDNALSDIAITLPGQRM